MRLRALSFSLVLVSFVMPPASAKGNPYQVFSLKEGGFRCEIPGNWPQKRDKDEDARRKVYGVFLQGPRSPEGIRAKAVAEYFAPENKLYPKAVDYLKANLEKGLVPVEGESTSPAKKTVLAGRPAQGFVRHTFAFVPPESLGSKRIAVTEEAVVLDYEKGFFVIFYSAPDSIYKRFRPKFQHMLDTFRLETSPGKPRWAERPTPP